MVFKTFYSALRISFLRIFTLHVGKGSFASVKQTLETNKTNLFGLKFLMVFFLMIIIFILNVTLGILAHSGDDITEKVNTEFNVIRCYI